MINYSPDTVSTDYNECDHIYFRELSSRRSFQKHHIVISHFIEGAIKIKMDGTEKEDKLIVAAIHKHFENVDVHSGCASLILPLYTISNYTKECVHDATCKILKHLNIIGPVNIQFITKDICIMRIECDI
eukprot:4189970-Ditylum_brightwellii.AAC.1